MLAPWPGPHGGAPPLEKVKLEHFEPAIEEGLRDGLKEIEAITDNPEPPSFENTIAALERQAGLLDRVMSVYHGWSSSLSSDKFEALDRKMTPLLSAYGASIGQNPKLFERIAAVYKARRKIGLNEAQRRLVKDRYDSFVHSGAKLDAKGKERLAAINQRLSLLSNQFASNVRVDSEGGLLTLSDERDLQGLPNSFRSTVATSKENEPDTWTIPATASGAEGFLTFSDRRDLRKQVLQAWQSRGGRGGETDNYGIATEMLKLRAEKARLLGYRSHAHGSIEETMAKTPEKVTALLEAIWPAALRRAEDELAELQAEADRSGVHEPIEAWDVKYYAEKVRQRKYDLDTNELKNYLGLDEIRDGMFALAAEQFDKHFTRVPGISGLHSTVEVYEVKNGAGEHVGYWHLDPFARDGKRQGAWSMNYRSQSRLGGDVSTINSNTANFLQGAPGEPVRMSWRDAQTLMHEFGHGMHALSSQVEYPSQSGTAVPRDAVEFPSQLFERWLSTPEFLQRFARHVETGAPMPPELIAKIQRSAKFMQGEQTLAYLSSARLDLAAHLEEVGVEDAAAFERDYLAALALPKAIPPRSTLGSFLHMFVHGYDAQYWSYIAADVLSADGFGAFHEASGPMDRKVSRRLNDKFLTRGGGLDPAKAYRNFRGRDPTIDALLEERGLTNAEAEQSH